MELFYDQKSPWAVAAAENRRLFAKEKKLFDAMMIGGWCGQVYDLRTSVTELMTKPPPKVKQVAESLGSVRTMKTTQVMTEKELHNFLIATQMLTSDEHQRELINIVISSQPEMETGKTDLYIDATKLSLQTVTRLKEYMTEALEKQGLKYPDQ